MIGGKANSTTRPSALGVALTASVYGQTIPTVYGTNKVPPLLTWNANLRTGNSNKKSKKKGVSTYVQNCDFLLASNPAIGPLQAWTNINTKFPLVFLNYTYIIPGSLPTLDTTFQILANGVADPHFYAVVGITATVTSRTGTFNDYGGQGSVSYGGSGDPTELPLWNSVLAGPDPNNSSPTRFYPYVYAWAPSDGNNIYLPNALELFALFDQINVYYAQLAQKISFETPISKLRLTYENVLGNGPEYSTHGNFTAQQILYPEYCGVGSAELDLGAGAAIPNMRIELEGSYPIYSQGDADFADMIEDIIRGGALQVGTQLGVIQRGLNCYDRPGVVQSNLWSDNSASEPNPAFYQPNNAGSVLLAACHFQSGAGLHPVIADTAGNTWVNVFIADNYALWYCASAIASTRNFVNFQISTGGGDNAAGAYIAELDPSSTQITVGSVVSGSGGASATASITVTGVGPFLLVAMYISDTGLTVGPVPLQWTPLIPGTVGQAASGNTGPFGGYRVVQNPGTYSVSFPLATAVTWKMVILGFQPSQPVSYPQPLGNILDYASLQSVRNQCRANGLIGSLYMDAQKKASEWLTDIYECADAWPVWSGFHLKSIARSEVSAFGNGTVFNSLTSTGPVANLSDLNGDFSGSASAPIISVKRKARLDAQNILQIQHPYRASDYNDVVTSQPETGSVSLYGPRKASPKRMAMIQDVAVARMILGWMVRKQTLVMNTYAWKAKAKWKLLEPGDLITITDSLGGISLLPVRITSCQEDEQFNIDMEAEPFIYGLYAPLPLTQGTNAPNTGDTSVVPGNVNPPIIFEAVPRLTQQDNQSDLVIAISNSDINAGGYYAEISTDGGNSFNALGSDPMVLGNAITGYVTVDWPTNTDPDTTNDLTVDLTESAGVLNSYQVADEDSFTYPCYVSNLAQPNFVQGAQNSSSATTSLAKAFTANVTAGNAILVAVGVGANTTPTIGISDNLGNSYSLIESSPSGGLSRTYFYLATGINAGTCTVTVTESVNQNMSILLHEYSGVTGFDVGASAHTASPTTAGPTTQAQPNELYVAAALSENVGASQTFAITSTLPFVQREINVPTGSIRAFESWDAASPNISPNSATVTAGVSSTISLAFVVLKGGGTYVATGIPYELMTYAVANLITGNKYTLKATGGGSNHLRRAVFGAPTVGTGPDHPIGCRFLFIGASEVANPPGILRVPLDPKWIGVTLYFKFLAINQFGSGMQDPTLVGVYSYTPTGVAQGVQNPNSYYTQTPAIALSEASATQIDMAQVTTMFPSNSVNYNARTFTIPDPGGTPTTYYVTIADPQQVGDTGAMTNLTATCQTSDALVGVTGNTYIGSIIANHTPASAIPGPGGNPPGQLFLVNGT